MLLLAAALWAGGLNAQATGPYAACDDACAGLSAVDWAGVQAAWESAHGAPHASTAHAATGAGADGSEADGSGAAFAVNAVDEGHRAHNPRQRWSTLFDGRGFLIEPEGGPWTWGLALRRYGFNTQQRDVDAPVTISTAGATLTHGWDDDLAEWYVNDARGLEHGYTILRRPFTGPTEPTGTLTFTLGVNGSLVAEATGNSRGVRFLDATGRHVLTYAGLKVFDAEGRDLPASLVPQDDALVISVDVTGAVYPVTVDPVAQHAYLKIAFPDLHDHFGRSVGVSGDTVVVGAYGEDSSATTINGDETDDSAPSSGAAFVFVREGAGWVQQAFLKPSNAEAGDSFGRSVAISRNTIVVGARDEDSAATGVNGDGSDNSALKSGAAYIFVRDGTTWSQQAYLKASNTGVNDRFGHSVAISRSTVVVGAELESSAATGVDGNGNDDSAPAAGAAYVFVRNGTTWTQQAYLKASHTDAGDRFGWPVAVSGRTAVIGAIQESSSATGVDGDAADDSAGASGAAYVFFSSGGTWSQQAYLKASNTGAGDAFGSALAIDGDTLLVGAIHEDSGATGVDGNQTHNGFSNAGAAYVFTRSGSTWSQQAYLKASNTDSGDGFGWSVAVDGDTVVVGAREEDSGATGINGDEADDTSQNAGSAYVYRRNGVQWNQKLYLKGANTGWNDVFGIAVACADDTVVVGAIHESSNSAGDDGNPGDNSVYHAGAAYIFDLDDPWADIGGATVGTFGTPRLKGAGDLEAGTAGSLDLDRVPGGRPALLLVSFAQGSTPIFGGTLKVAVPWNAEWLFVIPGKLDTSAALLLPWTSFPAVPSGFELVFQYLVEDPGHFSGVALSNGLSAIVP